ncbi:MAG: prepilin-type N-terminal cleavage/methylation domain-containing protein [Verrucomicrobiota bacterium]|nr:prepilin-type N-terminal cleavage/methylation domain-containing protein [Verrucomicrobiota bacterium]
MRVASPRALTLLELLISLAVVAFISGALFLSSRTTREKKRFSSDIARLSAHINMLQKIAMNTQTDWNATLSQKDEKWLFCAECTDQKARKIPDLNLGSFSLLIEGQRTDRLQFSFFSSGEVFPASSISCCLDDACRKIEVAMREAGEDRKKGPLHPNFAK